MPLEEPNRQDTPLLAIVGPTAAGKTALAIELARRLGGEIVSADSRQVYRYMNIGTAKPTPAECAAVPHHLVDVVDPDADFSLGLYQELATAAIADIARRGKLPLLVGGTGQYLAAVLQGWDGATQVYLGLATMNQTLGDANPDFAAKQPLRDPLGRIRVGLKKSYEPAARIPERTRTLYDTPNDYFNNLKSIVDGLESLSTPE